MKVRTVFSGCLVGLLIGCTMSVYCQSTDTTRVAILCVQLSDYQTNLDARGSVGFSLPPNLNIVENKYRYGDYWNILFQPSGEVVHPDAAFPDEYSRSRRGFRQYGSLRRYIDDNSYGLHHIVPYNQLATFSGILNSITPDSSQIPSRGIVNWLTLDVAKDSNFPAIGVVQLGRKAIRIAKDTFNVNWAEIDVVVILYAGDNDFGYSMAGDYLDTASNKKVNFIVTSERAATINNVQCFGYPRVIFHEFMHARFGATDFHHRNETDSLNMASGVGHFSLMGDNSLLGDYTPEMLDPWHRLRCGWLRYYYPNAVNSPLNIHVPIDTLNFQLPIVEHDHNGQPPYVLVIPTTAHPDTNIWNLPGWCGFIIENRRAIGWDSVIAVHENDPIDSAYSTRSGSGGFIIWRINVGTDPVAWVMDADADYETWQGVERYGEPSDIFDGSQDACEFTLASRANVFQHPAVRGGVELYPHSRSLYLKIAPYADSGSTNVISRLAIDRFVPYDHHYGNTEDADVSSTKYNAQHKFDIRDTIAMATLCQGDLAFAFVGSSLFHLSEVGYLNKIMSSPETIVQNAQVQYHPGTTSDSMFRATYVLQELTSNGYFVRSRGVAMNYYSAIGGGADNLWGPFQVEPRPVIAGDGVYSAMAFAADSGIMFTQTTDRGDNWSQPIQISGALQGCKQPYVGVFRNAFGAMATYALFVGGTNPNGVYLYRSDSLSIEQLSDTVSQNACENPIASVRLGQMRCVYQCLNTTKSMHYVVQAKADLIQKVHQHDYDAYGLKSQESYHVNRNPFVMFTDSADIDKFMVCWDYNNGEKLLIASLEDSPNGKEISGIESSLSSCVTSYPYLLPNEPGNPVLLVSRSGRLLPSQSTAFQDTLPAMVFLTMNEERNRNVKVQVLNSALGLDFTSPNQTRLHVTLEPAILLNVPDTLSHIQYSYTSSENYVSDEMINVTRTEPFGLFDTQLGVFPVSVSFSDYAEDTLVVEARLYSAITQDYVSSSGQMKIPPMIGDTTITLNVEAPSGKPPAEYFVRTTMSRGIFGANNPIPESITRYSLFSPQVQQKASVFAYAKPTMDNMINIYPHPVQGVARLVCFDGETSSVGIYDLLGRHVVESEMRSSGNISTGVIDVRNLRAGSYIVLVKSHDKAYNRMIEIVQ